MTRSGGSAVGLGEPLVPGAEVTGTAQSRIRSRLHLLRAIQARQACDVPTDSVTALSNSSSTASWTATADLDEGAHAPTAEWQEYEEVQNLLPDRDERVPAPEGPRRRYRQGWRRTVPLWCCLLPDVAGPGLSLFMICVWYLVHEEPLRSGLIMAALAALAFVIMRQFTSANMAYAMSVGNTALLQANQELAAMNKHLHLLATTDPLTGLGNRAILDESSRARGARHQEIRCALLLLDLDRFKEVNDTLGHRCGDLLLKQLAVRLLDIVGQSGRIARLGGDEFAIVLPGANLAFASDIARRCNEALDTSFSIDGHSLCVAGSIGVSLAPDHGRDISTLLRCADVAMYVAKRRHGGFTVFDPKDDRHSAQRLALAGALQQTIASNGLCLYYQPIAQLASGQTCRVEALVRWDHPEYGFLSPDQFIPLAEQTGLIVPLTRWAIETALWQCRRWQNAGLSLGVAVNVSMRNLEDAHLPELVLELLRKTEVAPHLLTLEITETMLMADPPTTHALLERLHRIGVRLAIDDFGTGHSSLGYLKSLPVHELKIDQAFVLNMATAHSTPAAKDRMIVRSVIALAHALRLEVVAEGVETKQAWDLLATFRCDAAQGFILNKPLPAPELELWLRSAANGAPASVAKTQRFASEVPAVRSTREAAG